MRFDNDALAIDNPLIRLAGLAPLVNGAVAATEAPEARATAVGATLTWRLDAARAGATFVLDVARRDLGGVAGGKGREGLELCWRLVGVPAASVDSFGLRIAEIGNLRSYLRNGTTSWDGSYFVEPEALRGLEADPAMGIGYAMAQLLPRVGQGSVVLGALRHDRFQHRFRFEGQPTTLEVETLWDRVPGYGDTGNDLRAEPFVLFAHDGVEEALRLWARLVAASAERPPRLPARRIAGWCSWYNLYAAIDEAAILEHLAAAQEAAREAALPLGVFQIDDGFTPEMGDWLEVKPQFPRGMEPVLAAIRDAGFTPGLWIAPFLVGNRSRLFGEHPDWVVRERASGAPLAAMRFYGEFRWHKRSEEYYVLDVTHPEAETYIRQVFRTWAEDWGCRYFKTDFMHVAADHGPDRAVWHRPGLSRIEVYGRMLRLIREAIGDALWLGCGAPLLPSVGYVDAMRIGRDVGVSWSGRQSAASLLRDQATRNYTHGILWQADPDCVLLRRRFHHLSDREVEALALYAGLAGGVAMTSDHLGEIPAGRLALWRFLLADGAPKSCDFPFLGQAAIRYRPSSTPEGTATLVAESDPVIVQRAAGFDPADPAAVAVNVFNTGDAAVERQLRWQSLGLDRPGRVRDIAGRDVAGADAVGLHLRLEPHEARLVIVGGAASG